MIKHHVGEQLANSLPLFIKGEPYTIDEIDQHPDRERIWRTIQEVVFYHENLTSDLIYTQEEMDEVSTESYESGRFYGRREVDEDYESGWDEGYRQGYKEGWDDCNESCKLENKEGR